MSASMAKQKSQWQNLQEILHVRKEAKNNKNKLFFLVLVAPAAMPEH